MRHKRRAAGTRHRPVNGKQRKIMPQVKRALGPAIQQHLFPQEQAAKAVARVDHMLRRQGKTCAAIVEQHGLADLGPCRDMGLIRRRI